ncbi:ADP-ribose 1''-phosphate phosphatase [Komagataella phaffii CBS 7435]|uniref:ADP-ribose 1''-phosphate phosphatase n=2 Tax=Komagataella phaffii TaxID=460519 RepID=C4QZJ7_KOMPG|nr:Phosphatase that is highly specific for ADP-ribose 1''-phosphate, a tRNA splicing metabolite [Komagataella phaffii GS115]AOA63019.1 GQ67_00093T0 [Komagataella phaffii]CAH2448834.1 ADP-ribose 1''-phosphate phosphatase [Komagataella phaffii CBS 7435]AOA67902.1 GQ68_01294T0 [Komagataella phaffii GS115]CAY68671.1 Phosphatase that is highly specific for ADP-ribose 1''-phosphate, a tRNA splicing metabolite [Komagataella phaffii GS115]CCA38915.1 ADP-ribose 1''-phosphate phosphatase [Komagataella p
MVKYINGDVFAILNQKSNLPVILAHSCNCFGSWGGGIAFALKQKFPSSYTLYSDYCSRFQDNPQELLGKCLLLPISKTDPGYTSVVGDKFLIACLFTGASGGKAEILKYTDVSLSHLGKIIQSKKSEISIPRVDEILQSINTDDVPIYLPKINSGIFGVPWPNTEKILENHNDLKFVVYSI